MSEAFVKLNVAGTSVYTAAEGNGPVNALDNALRKALVQYFPSLAHMHLSDYKVRVLDEKDATAAKVRVLIESKTQKTPGTRLAYRRTSSKQVGKRLYTASGMHCFRKTA